MSEFFGHPRGLATLFMTEFWERFSYYGMAALLILFMTAPASRGGLDFPIPKAGVIFGIYVALVYLGGLPGGWIADRVFGQRKSVLYGGIIIASGHYCLAIPTLKTFYLGLGLIITGTALLKPNVSTMVGQLYAPGDVRRDAGFSIFYMGINLGAFVAPLGCSYLGVEVNWHYGFGLAGVGMTLGIIQYVMGWKHLGQIGLPPRQNGSSRLRSESSCQPERSAHGLPKNGVYTFRLSTFPKGSGRALPWWCWACSAGCLHRADGRQLSAGGCMRSSPSSWRQPSSGRSFSRPVPP